MKWTSLIFMSFLSLHLNAQDGRTYKPDENHLPGARSPALQKQAQEERTEDSYRRKEIRRRRDMEMDKPAIIKRDQLEIQE